MVGYFYFLVLIKYSNISGASYICHLINNCRAGYIIPLLLLRKLSFKRGCITSTKLVEQARDGA